MKSEQKNKLTEQQRLYNMTEHERQYWARGIAVAGLDEVGRGPLAGPVVAASVMLPAGCVIEGVNDSKKLSKKKLEALYEKITASALAVGIGQVSHTEIDRINILNATKKAFALAFKNMNTPCEVAFIDAVTGLEIPAEQRSIIHGDALCYSIAAASIVAKVERDRLMVRLAKSYPQYGFEKNVGYGTKQHIEALEKYGPCEIHRRSFLKNFKDRMPENTM